MHSLMRKKPLREILIHCKALYTITGIKITNCKSMKARKRAFLFFMAAYVYDTFLVPDSDSV